VIREMRTTLLFPGQGSQVPGMRDAVAASRPDLVELAMRLVGDDPFARIDDGTRFVQPALYCASVAQWEAAGRPAGDLYAGHSLGEVAALVAAGSIDSVDGLRLAVRRGELMQAAAEAQPDGGMLAVLGDDALARELAAANLLAVANDNAPGQIVLSGPSESLDAVAAEAKQRGVRSVRLAIQGAFHSPAMAPAVPRFRSALAAIDIRSPRAPVISGVTAAPMGDVRASLAEALVRPVRWRETLGALRDLGAERFVEVGPGKVLKGLVRRTLTDVSAMTLADREPAHA
jgi:malonyl CoA-acyl carrier protein transacylase